MQRPNSDCAARTPASKCSGCVFMVSSVNQVLSVSRDGAARAVLVDVADREVLVSSARSSRDSASPDLFRRRHHALPSNVIPAQAGIHALGRECGDYAGPACAG